MKAAVFHKAGQPLAIETVDDPKPQAGEVIIKVKHCGICGTDLHATEEHGNATDGTVLGHEFAGEVVDVSKDIKGLWKEGDRLCSIPFIGCGTCIPCLTGKPWLCATKLITGFDITGGLAEYVRVHVNEAVKLPQSMSWKEGALVEPLAVGLHGVRRGGNVESAKCLVIGAGPIGLSVTTWLRFFGAGHIVVSELDPGRGGMAAQMGATHVINPKDGDVGEQFAKIAGGPPDIVYECVGVPGMIQQAVMLANFNSRVVVVGFCAQPDTFIPALAMAKDLDMIFVIAYDKSDFQFTVDMIASDRLDVEKMVTDVVSFDQLPGAFEALRKPTTQCKVLLAPGL